MRIENNCCHNCEKRHLGCHGTCPDYIEYDRQNRERREKMNEIKENQLKYRNDIIRLRNNMKTKRASNR